MNFISEISKRKRSVFQAGAIAVAIIAIVFMGKAFADEITLYDGSLGNTPDLQGWVSGFSSSAATVCNICQQNNPFLPCPVSGEYKEYLLELCGLLPETSTQVAEQGATVLDTTADGSELAGYMTIIPGFTPDYIASLSGLSVSLPSDFSMIHPDMPEFLDNTAGFNLSFEVRLVEEEHDYDDRSGFSLVVNSQECSADGCKGIEIGFWPGEIWVQGDGDDENGLFYRAEIAAFDTTKMTAYDLSIRKDTYELFADGVSVLSGRLRDYTTYEDTLYVTVYQTPNFIFFGDDTESAKARISLRSVRLRPLSLGESLIALQLSTGAYAEDIPPELFTLLDMDDDGKIGLEDVIQILQAIVRASQSQG